MTFDIYQSITNKIITALESGTMPWLKPWKDATGKVSTNALHPFNGSTGRNYTGTNLLLLGCTSYSSNAWYSYKQCEALGGNVKKGEKSTMVIYWQFSRIKDKVTGEETQVPFIKYYNVFNFEQCENLPEPKQVQGEPITYNSIDALVKDLGIGLQHNGNRAFYVPSMDVINMPVHSAFESEAHYNATLLHETTHATGHKTRCNRDFSGRFGNEEYAFEELVAEIGSAFLSAHLGVTPLLQHNASYLASWLKVLKSDKKAIVTASSQAQKACQWVLEALKAEAEPEAIAA